MSTETQIGEGHVFTVIGTRNEPVAIVAIGDKQAWNPSADRNSGTLVVTRDKEDVAFWKDKTFLVDRFDENRYTCESTVEGVTTTITLLFELGRHVTLHTRVWMLFGTSVSVGGDVGTGDPTGGWGGQNLK